MERAPGAGTGTKRPSVELAIEELVLHGFSPGDRLRIGAAVERELGRLLSAESLPAALEQGGERPVLNGGSFEVRPNARPETIGAQVARAIYGGLSK